MIAYLANEYPSAVEPYVTDEIRELRRRGLHVTACSVKRPRKEQQMLPSGDVLYLFPLHWLFFLRSFFFLFNPSIRKTLRRIFRGRESFSRRIRALAHTWLGAYLAMRLRNKGIEHIHVHHGYFSAWVAMTTAKLLGISYSITLHGSDLLLHAVYLDEKLENCSTCFTVSEFNRNHIRKHYPSVPASRVVVSRLGVETSDRTKTFAPSPDHLRMLCVGRLHKVKNHVFLVHACRILKDRGCSFTCTIAGNGPELKTLGKLIIQLGLGGEITLAGHIGRNELDEYYAQADLVVLTSRSEGIPVVLMEAMARRKIVLAPAITGIPELVTSGKNGFLYAPGSMQDFACNVETIKECFSHLAFIRKNARLQVRQNFNREKNLAVFAQIFIEQLPTGKELNANPVLQ